MATIIGLENARYCKCSPLRHLSVADYLTPRIGVLIAMFWMTTVVTRVLPSCLGKASPHPHLHPHPTTRRAEESNHHEHCEYLHRPMS